MAAHLARLAAAPLTGRQLGAIHGEFRRLGYRDRWDRAARLTATAALARCTPIATTKDLTEGEAGRVVGILRQCADADDLAAALAAARPEPRRWLAAALAALAGPRARTPRARRALKS
jgi:hypothetical protein